MQPPVLETPRLILRPHVLADFDDMAAMWGDAAVTRFIGGKPATPEETWARLLRYAGHWRLLGLGYWCVRERVTGAYVGDVGLMRARRPLPPPFGDYPEVGWALNPVHHGQGYATEAVSAALAWGEAALGAATCVCIIEPANAPSLAVARRCGFQAYGRADYHGDILLLRRDAPASRP